MSQDGEVVSRSRFKLRTDLSAATQAVQTLEPDREVVSSTTEDLSLCPLLPVIETDLTTCTRPHFLLSRSIQSDTLLSNLDPTA